MHSLLNYFLRSYKQNNFFCGRWRSPLCTKSSPSGWPMACTSAPTLGSFLLIDMYWIFLGACTNWISAKSLSLSCFRILIFWGYQNIYRWQKIPQCFSWPSSTCQFVMMCPFLEMTAPLPKLSSPKIATTPPAALLKTAGFAYVKWLKQRIKVKIK